MYQWKRFWCPRTGTFNLADGGYLVDPESEHAKWFGSDAVPFSKIVETPCLALLGEPGIGKSTAIASDRDTIAQALTKTGDRLLWIDLREYGDEGRLLHDVFESPEFTAWLTGTHTLHLFLDSLDECRLLAA